jgi:hypothetical protein
MQDDMRYWPTFLTFPRPPDFIIGTDDDPYLHRWRLFPKNGLFNVYLHHFLRSDDDRALHDHPYANVSFILKGSYLEHMDKGATPYIRRYRGQFAIVFRRAATPHRVELIGDSKPWTLFLSGPRVREWGFHCLQGWVPWQKFVEVRPGGNAVGKGCEQ